MKKPGFLLIILVVFALMLVGCDFPPQRSGSTAPDSDVVDTGAGTGDAIVPGSASTLDVILAQTQSAASGNPVAAGETGGGVNPSLDEQYLTAEAGVTQTANASAVAPVVTATPTQAPTATPIPEPAVPDSYALRKGEHPYCIARRFDVNAQALIRVNGIIPGQILSVGTNLIIPKDAGGFEGDRHLRAHGSYVTQAGDNFFIIACTIGDISPEVIAAANGMDVNASLTSGQTIQIP